MTLSVDLVELQDARRARVKSMTAAGMSAAEIAAALRISQRTVVRDRRHGGISVRPPAAPLTATEFDVASRLIAEGCSYAEVARTIGRCWSTVAKHFPGHSWSKQECGQFRAALRLANERMKAVAV